MSGKWSHNGEWLRKAELTYIVTGGDPRQYGWHFELDHNENLMLVHTATGRRLPIIGSVSIGNITVTQKVGGVQQKDIT